MSGLRAVAVRVDRDADPVAFAGATGVLWRHDGLALAGRGEALRPSGSRVELARVVGDALAGIEIDSEVDTAAPVALGALPFATHAPASLVVPEVTYGRSGDGTRWLCWVGERPPSRAALLAELATCEPLPDAPTSFRLHTPQPAPEWCASVLAARDELRRGAARKVVLAREVVIEADVPLARHLILEHLRRRFPTCFLFSVPGLLGASPELLVSRRGDVVRSQPMAGTSRRSPDATADARLAASLLSSGKDRVEHQITIDVVHDALLPWCSYLDAEADPHVVSIANVHHLATAVEGRLSEPLPSVLELVSALHPTPAVCGDPAPAAADLIERFERFERGCFAAPVGWVDARGNGEWAVGVRSAAVEGHRARLFAGVGVVEDSDPEAELEETQLKLEAMLGAIVRL